ncbi:four helix bundle protein, partial [Patescibacteria group bacterium]|nr:four helix bundle protein [Patescibacteria group bacterium]
MFERSYRKLVAWQEAHALCLWIYEITKRFPSEEIYSLTKQIRRSAYSVPTNIAEGNCRRSKKDKAHFFVIALSSLDELHYQCTLALDLHYITNEQFKEAEGQI